MNRSLLRLISCVLIGMYVPVTPCYNDPDFTYYYAGQYRNCQNIRIDNFRREEMCGRFEEVVENCPQTCGRCCEDDPEYRLKTKGKDGKLETCEWVGEEEERKDTYCSKWSKGRMIRDACPFSCDFCQPSVLIDPPLIDEPISIPTRSPTKSPTRSPTTSPTISPTMTPTTSPTKQPTLSPTQSSNQPTIECVNDPEYFVMNDPSFNCLWIAETVGRRQEHCQNDESYIACPQICGVCCENIDGYKITTKLGTSKGCGWIAQEKIRQNRYCETENNGYLVKEACPVACGFCFDD